jgi:hypothetical protein
VAIKALAKLQTNVREHVTSAKHKDRIIVSDILDAVADEHPKLVEAEKNRLYRETAGGWVRRMLREDDPGDQLGLPLKLVDEVLPGRIPLRLDGTRSGPAAYVKKTSVSLNELDRYVSGLREPRFSPEQRGASAVRDYLVARIPEALRDRAIPELLRWSEEQEKSADA